MASNALNVAAKPKPAFVYTQERDADYFQEEAYDIIRTIMDPEFPHTLEQLNVVD